MDEVNRTAPWENRQKCNDVGQCYSVLAFHRKPLSTMGTLVMLLGNKEDEKKSEQEARRI